MVLRFLTAIVMLWKPKARNTSSTSRLLTLTVYSPSALVVVNTAPSFSLIATPYKGVLFLSTTLPETCVCCTVFDGVVDGRCVFFDGVISYTTTVLSSI